ncbi:hypothetical protein [Thalassotalea sp. Y01]|uniref:hypothetical protein n=1 Tax=Thalassotalea sp. Y01 TaxID=2729613 RepID=UPI00145D33D3|nr:hypothetical protein [Thalassotalea sp. Y01]NMP14838.1 hypothetical protein [Thalassotalea sp. Y01]
MKNTIATLLIALLISGCAATWDNMSEETIGEWKANGVDVETANYLTENRVTPEQYAEWKAVKITDPEMIVEWSEAKFSASEARAWMDGGFELDDAIDNRSEGLSPTAEKQ